MTTFSRLFNSILYQTTPNSSDIGWCGYIFNGSGTPPATGVSLPELFPNVAPAYPNGIFVFSSTPPNIADENAANTFASLVLKTLVTQFGSQGQLNYYAIVWLQNPGLIQSSTMNVITLSYTTFYSVVNPLSYNPSQNVELAVSSSSPCRLDENGTLFNFFNTNPISPTLSLNTQFNSNFKNTIQNIYIPTAGPLMGCLVFDIKVPSNNFNYPVNIAALNYFYPGTSTTVNRFTYPLFDTGIVLNDCSYYCAFDPNNPLNKSNQLRTFIIPTANALGGAVFPSGFSTDSGLPIGISAVLNKITYPQTSLIWMPTASTGMLMYANNQQNAGNNYDLIPQGEYSLSLWNQPLQATGKSLNLLGGLSGLETFSFRPATATYSGDLLTFITGQAAYAEAYIAPSEASNETGTTTLNTNFTTAYIAISNGVSETTNNLYYAQPNGASLYAAGYGVNQTSPGFLGFFEPVACTLKANAPLIPLPMVPYRGMNLEGQLTAQTNYNDFELRVLSTNRKLILGPAAKSGLTQNKSNIAKLRANNELTDSPLIYSTSPQGLLVQVDTATNQWEQLVLAANTNVSEAGNPIITMEFLDLNPTLQSAFQTNQQFLVMSWNKPVTPGGEDYVLYGSQSLPADFANEMVIEGWPFVADLPLTDPNGVFTNVMIFKFCTGTLMDRIKDSSTWTTPEVFNSTTNNNLQLLQQWATDYCTAALNKYQAGDTNYYQFATIIQDPNWNGILLLKCDIRVSDFPPELQGLLAGIDLSRFYGHHFGINVNHISLDNDGKLTMSPVSSLFGLIDYTDPVFDQNNDNVATYLKNVSNPPGNYNYKVLSLKVLFANSAIQNFNSFVQLSINNLFGTAIKPVNNSNIIIFTGAYENHNGIPNYTFNETGDNLLALNSNAINGIEIVKASFVTEQPQKGADATMVNVKFSFWGFMNFAAQEFDLYSFGSPLDNNGNNQFINGDGLSYSNMAINMRFAMDTSAIQLFTFDVSQMAYDLGQSNWRSGSLYGHFPLQLTGILTGDSTSQPAAQGYIPLPIPGMAGSSAWAGTWYGLVFNLNMGTMGALTNALGFNSALLMVWTAGSNAEMGAMIQLPGFSTQSKTLSLQGVLGLKVGNMQLQAAQNQEGGNPVAYMLSMNQITLKFLSFNFPSSGAVNFYLFGDPNTDAQPSSLGWYLGYQAKK